MPRYIDVETALKIIDNYAKTVTADGIVVVKAIRDIVEIITPTADVVPKSEVDSLKAEAENLRNANADLSLALLYECAPTVEHLSELEKAVRQKLASEIFAEIEKYLLFNAYDIALISHKTFDALKKKYIGGNDDRE